jgi:hypothetical protein
MIDVKGTAVDLDDTLTCPHFGYPICYQDQAVFGLRT